MFSAALFPVVFSGSLDPEVAAWRSAITANGGSVGGGASAAVNRFVLGCKADALWSSLLDVGLFAGVDNLASALVKIKVPTGGQRVLTNNNFVTADYTSTGTNAGILGNGSSKFLSTGLLQSSISTGNLSFGVYTSSIPANGQVALGADSTGNTVRTRLRVNSTRRTELYGVGADVLFMDTAYANTAGFDVAVGSSTRIARFFNGTQLGTQARTSGGVTTTGDAIFAVFASGLPSGANAHTAQRISAYFIGEHLTDTQVANLSTRMNTLMTAFGANAY